MAAVLRAHFLGAAAAGRGKFWVAPSLFFFLTRDSNKVMTGAADIAWGLTKEGLKMLGCTFPRYFPIQ